MTRHLLAFALLFCTSSAIAGEKAEKPKLKGLLVTGGCCHDYETQKKILTEGLGQRASIAWDVVHEGGTSRDHRVSKYMDKDWAKEYDVIVHNECFGAVKDPEFVAKIVGAHQRGVPGIFVHCSLHSYRAAEAGADGWRELIGVTSRRHEKHRPVVAEKVNDEHPIMQGFPEKWPTPNGELYVIEKVWPNCVPLATAYGEDTERVHPVMWVNTFGKARVFGTSLGHHNETMNTDVWLDTVARGLLWTVDKLDENGKPKQGYEGTGVKPIELGTLKPIADPKFAKSK